MAIHSSIGASKRSSRATIEATTLPTPIRGMDGRRSLSEYDPSVCIYTYNILTTEYGMKVRSGYREYALNTDNGGATTGIKTLVPYEGVAGAADDKLFAVTNEGIWDVTTEGDTAPTLKVAFPDLTGAAGIGVYTHYIDGGGDNLLYYADGQNGLFAYDPAADTWAAITTEMTGVDPSKVKFIVAHKQRLWMIEEDSTIGWYLPIASKSGQAKEFNFGSQFKHGGLLVGLFNWTVDGGSGVDDFLVAISSSGDVLPYKGSDPEAASGDLWGIKGVYFIGAVAGSKRCASESGGDLYILSTYGITNMTDLLSGVDTINSSHNVLGGRLGRLLRRDMEQYRLDDGWGIDFLPSEGMLIINTPKRVNGVYIQYAYDIATDSFGMWREVPMSAFTAWRSTVYLGTADNRVLAMDVGLDNVELTPPVDDQNGQDINFSLLFSYSNLGTPSRYKRAQMARPDFIASDTVQYKVKFKFDYDLTELLSQDVRPNSDSGVWDTSDWDAVIWADDTLENVHNINGSFGYGRVMSIAVQGAAKSETWLLSVDIMWNNGGML